MKKTTQPPNRHSRPIQTDPEPRKWLWGVLIGAGVLLLTVVVFLAFGQSQPGSTVSAQGPRLEVDQMTVDYGQVKYNTPIQTVFKLHNIGDAPLVIQKKPQVELIEGC